MSRAVLGGSADFSTVIRIVDSTDGTPEQGVVAATAGLALWYRREGGLVVALTESDLAAADSAHADGGMIHLDDGYYRVDLPDAAVAAGAGGVLVGGAATGMVVIGAYHPIDEPGDVTKWLGTACHAATVAGVPIVQLHDSAGAGGINAPPNFEDLAIVDTTGVVTATPTGDLSATMKTSVAQYTGYQMGAVWFDTNGAAGAVSYVNGIITNPCSSPVNTHTLLTNLNLKVIRVVNGSTYTLEATYTGVSWVGEKWTLNLSGQQIANCYFEGATISGTSSNTGNQFYECQVGTVTMAAGATQASACTLRSCGLTGTFTIGAAGIFTFYDCYSEVSAAGDWVLDFAAVGATTINSSGFSGSMEVRNMAAGDVLVVSGSGRITLTAPCAGTLYLRGHFELIPGTATTTIVDTSRWNEDQQLALVTTLTTYTGNTPQTGDSFDRIGLAGAGLTALGDARLANLDAAVTTRATPAQVNTEVVDALNVDTYAEPAQGAPAATASLVAKLGYLYKAWRNKSTQTATELKIYNDAEAVVDHKTTVSDDATMFTRGEIASGP